MQKDVSQPFHNFVAGAMASTNTIYSTISNILHKDSVAIQLNWTGTPVGSFYVQVSNDYKPALAQSEGCGAPNNGNWIQVPLTNPLTGSTALTKPTTDGNPMGINLNQLGWAWIQVVYTNSSGSGTLTGTITAKSLG
jgi:hypothetical protein